MPLAFKTAAEPNHRQDGNPGRPESYNRDQLCAAVRASRSLGPFLILPAAGPSQTEAIGFFEYISIKHLNEHHPCESWRKTLMFFSQTVPSVRHAATALALMHRDYLERNPGGRVPQSSSWNNRPPDTAPLLHYNQAIRLLLNLETGSSTENQAITLLVCYLFVCFDHLAGNYVQAMKHLRGGVELAHSMEKAIWAPEDGTLIRQVARQIRRLDMQAVTFLVDWTPVDIEETPLVSQFQLLPLYGTFRSLDEAADNLQILVARAMRLRHTLEQQLSLRGTEMPPPPLLSMGALLGQLETWSCLSEEMLQLRSSTDKTDSEGLCARISLLRLQHMVTRTLLLASCTPGKEMAYDSFLPQFQQCVALASDVAAAHERCYSASEPAGKANPTFTPEVGILPVLYIIGVKCRHHAVRREALGILRRQQIREAVWDSVSAARIVERVIELEEGGLNETRSMGQIAVWQRVETMSWVQFVGGQAAARVDITYTFCGREGVHVESLAV